MDTNKSFDAIHALQRVGRYLEVISTLIDSGTGCLRLPYRWDANHAWYCVGLAELERCEFQIAAVAFRRAFKSNPADFQSLLALGNCYDELKKPKLAERIFNRALELSPSGKDKAALHVNLANALYDQQKFDEAIENYRFAANRRDAIGKVARRNLKRALQLV